MGLFSSRSDPRKDLAKAIAKRGVRVRGTLDTVEADGTEVTARVRFTTESGEDMDVTVVQLMAPQNQVGLDPGEPVEISYDRDDPNVVLIWGSPKYRVNEAGAVVRIVDIEGGEKG